MRIAIDAMGGERGPDEIVRGAAAASVARPAVGAELELILVGDTAQIGKVLSETRHDAERVRIQHAAQVVYRHERAAEALAAKPGASVTVAAELVAAGEADAMISASPAAAGVLTCARHFRKLAGVSQPALAAVYPTEMRRGEKDDPFVLLLDVGPSLDPTADDLVIFGLMGATYASRISKNARPRVALLGSGFEPGRAPRAVAEAADLLLKQTTLNYVGHVAALEIPRGHADVLVCAGFVGDVAIQLLEGVPDTVMSLARHAYQSSLVLRSAAGVVASGVQRLKRLYDWPEYGGAPIVGYDRVYIDVHGASRARSVHNAVKVCAKAVHTQVNHEIATRVAEYLALRAAPPAVGPA